MAARRSSRPRSGGARSRRPARRSSQSSTKNTGIIIAAGVGVVAVLIGIATIGGNNDKPQQPAANKPAGEVSEKEPDPHPRRDEPRAAARSGTTPDRPAPPIPPGVFGKSDELYAKAKRQHDDARRAQSTGDNAKFNKLINDSWDTFTEIESVLETYTGWFEEADLDGWRLPSDYVSLQRRLEKYDRLKGRVHRIKPNRR